MTTMLGISGSLRKGSFNTSLLNAAVSLMPEGAQLEIGTIKGIPLYDGDVEAASGSPDAVKALKEQIVAARGLMVSGAGGVFDAAGNLTDDKIRAALRDFLKGFTEFAVK